MSWPELSLHLSAIAGREHCQSHGFMKQIYEVCDTYMAQWESNNDQCDLESGQIDIMTGGEEISLAEEEIPSDGGGDGNIDEEKHTLINHDPYQYSPRDLRLQCSNVFWFGLCMLVFSVGLFAVMYHRAYSDAAGEKKLWAFSIDSPGMQLEDTLKHLAGPIMEAVSYEWQQYDSDLIHTQYFGAPSKEHDATWKELWDRKPYFLSCNARSTDSQIEGDIGFPYDKLSAINKSKKDYNWWRMPPPDDNQVIAFPEGESISCDSCCLHRIADSTSSDAPVTLCGPALAFLLARTLGLE